jgi:hypothetical protein
LRPPTDSRINAAADPNSVLKKNAVTMNDGAQQADQGDRERDDSDNFDGHFVSVLNPAGWIRTARLS